MSYLDALNPMQREAVTHTDGPLLIFAGAGSGKTRVLTYRVARLIECGVDPYNIIAITFTNKAAREMRERVNGITPLGERVWVSTFHSACVRLLRREIHKIGYDNSFSIFDAQDAERLIKLCVQELNLDEKLYNARYAANVISAQKNELIDAYAYERAAAGDFRARNIAEIYTLYQKKLASNNALDFDDIIFKTVELFEQRPETLEYWQNRFHYVLVDEYQDTNTAQYRFINLLSGYQQNLCVVGDDDQSIYGWRGANIKNILRFTKDYPGARVIKLEQNYRSTKTILDAANAVIGNNRNRSAKRLWTENGQGARVRVYKAYNEGEEAAFVVKNVAKAAADGARYNDFAVLYRNNAQSRAVEDQLVMAGVPYRLYGGVRFYERMEVRDILAYLKAIHNPADDLAVSRIINVPRRGIGGASMSRLLAYAAATGVPLSEALKDADNVPGLGKKSETVKQFAAFMSECTAIAAEKPVSAVLEYILESTRYLETLYDGTPEGESRVENVRELLTKAAEFERGTDNKTLGAFLEEVALVADVDNYEENADTVTLMTLHSAKGLEFNTVFIIGFEENLFPASRSALSSNPDELEEERRLCYVGFTRAKQTLYVTHAVSRMLYGQTWNNAPSRFLKEVPKEYIETVGVTPVKRTAPGGAAKRTGEADKAEKNARYDRPASNPYLNNLAPPKGTALDFKQGDRVRQAKYGVGECVAIRAAGADYEVTVRFDGAGVKKFMAHLSKLEKAD